MRQGQWPRTRGVTLEGRSVGLVGLGAIGKEVARRLAGFDVRILAFDVQQDAAFAAANGVAVCCLWMSCSLRPISSACMCRCSRRRGDMVDAAFLAQMKRGSYLINTSRGEVIDEAGARGCSCCKNIWPERLLTLSKRSRLLPMRPYWPLRR